MLARLNLSLGASNLITTELREETMKRLSMMVIFGCLSPWPEEAIGTGRSPVRGRAEAKAEAKGKGKARAGGAGHRERREPPSGSRCRSSSMPSARSNRSTASRCGRRPTACCEAVLFKEGDPVKQGQVLFRIDSRPMTASVEQAHGRPRARPGAARAGAGAGSATAAAGEEGLHHRAGIRSRAHAEQVAAGHGRGQ